MTRSRCYGLLVPIEIALPEVLDCAGVPKFPVTLKFLTFVLLGVEGEGSGNFNIQPSVLAPDNQAT